MKSRGVYPYKLLGSHLRALREKAAETLAEVSVAIELETEMLHKIEKGEQRPTEDILLLLLNHFEVEEKEADRLWEIAGYLQDKGDSLPDLHEAKAAVIVIPLDSRIVFTDMFQMSTNEYGVVLNFMQNLGNQNQPLSVARLGMSREQARQVLDVLQSTLDAKPKLLPPTTSN